MPSSIDPAAASSAPKLDLAANLADVRERMARACRAAGRDPAGVRLLPVSKTVPPDILREAYAAGCRCFGENKVQEAQAKAEALADLPIDWCVIGHLQTNKVRHVARFAAEVHSLDSARLARELDRRLQAEGRRIRVLVQVNTSGEDTKSGAAPDDVAALLRELAACDALEVRGFMTLAANSDDPARVLECFRLLRTIRERARHDGPHALSYDELSMGMSGDFEMAIAEGATIVRVGQAIFGARQPVAA